MVLQRVSALLVEAIAITARITHTGVIVDDFQGSFEAAEKRRHLGRQVDQDLTIKSGLGGGELYRIGIDQT